MYKSFKNILIESCKIKLLEALMDPPSFADKIDKELYKQVDVVDPEKIKFVASKILKDYWDKESNLGNGTDEKFQLETLRGEIVDATKENLRNYAKDVIFTSRYRKYFYQDTFTVKGDSLIDGIIQSGLECFAQAV